MFRVVDDSHIHHVQVKHSTVGYLRHDMATIAQHFRELIDDIERLIEDNIASDLFIPAATIDQKAEERLQLALNPPITVVATHSKAQPPCA